MSATPIQEDHRIIAIREIEDRLRRLDKIESALQCVDNQDWDYLVSLLGAGGRDRFWIGIIRDLRKAIRR